MHQQYKLKGYFLPNSVFHLFIFYFKYIVYFLMSRTVPTREYNIFWGDFNN